MSSAELLFTYINKLELLEIQRREKVLEIHALLDEARDAGVDMKTLRNITSYRLREREVQEGQG